MFERKGLLWQPFFAFAVQVLVVVFTTLLPYLAIPLLFCNKTQIQ